MRLQCINDLQRKTMNARAGACFQLFTKKHIGHYAKKGMCQSLSAALQASSKATTLKVQNKEVKPELDIDEEATDELMPVNIESDDQSSEIVHMDELIEQEEWCETYKESMGYMMKLHDM